MWQSAEPMDHGTPVSGATWVLLEFQWKSIVTRPSTATQAIQCIRVISRTEQLSWLPESHFSFLQQKETKSVEGTRIFLSGSGSRGPAGVSPSSRQTKAWSHRDRKKSTNGQFTKSRLQVSSCFPSCSHSTESSPQKDIGGVSQVRVCILRSVHLKGRHVPTLLEVPFQFPRTLQNCTSISHYFCPMWSVHHLSIPEGFAFYCGCLFSKKELSWQNTAINCKYSNFKSYNHFTRGFLQIVSSNAIYVKWKPENSIKYKLNMHKSTSWLTFFIEC